MICNQCDWQPDPEQPRGEQQLAHIASSGHRLCVTCHRSLRDIERDNIGCEQCITDARALLSGIVTMWAELPQHLGHIAGRSNSGPVTSDGRPLPGGDILVLLSGGSEGLSEDGTTSKDNDAPSVSFDLGWWAMAWSTDRDEFIKFGHSPARIIERASGYLETRTRWAAEHCDGWEQYVADLKRLHERLERATGRSEATVRANADCFDCGGQLVRKDTATGLSDLVTCRRCHRTYTTEQYALALRAAQEGEHEAWVPIKDAAIGARVSVDQLKKWIKREDVEAACRTSDGRQVVWWPSVVARLRRRMSA